MGTKPKNQKIVKVKGFIVVGTKGRFIALVGAGNTLTDHTLTAEEGKKLKTKVYPVTLIYKKPHTPK